MFTKATTSAPWITPPTSNGTGCSDPTNPLGHPTTDNLITIKNFSSDIFSYSPDVYYDSNGNPYTGVVCKQSGTYYVQIVFNNPSPFLYYGYIYYNLSGVLNYQMWEVPENSNNSQFIPGGTYLTLTMRVNDYIYLTGYCTKTKITGTLNIATPFGQ